ncbi:MAG: prolyl oligopeptidase family serine peptidase [Victivallaceae bacterium]|nr:prolyl oligopeptidase family serine peptidase [Victivallaceae bacterium]MDD4180705.1 prolyl oligopeptidase family serine peptidase [Victivallaceae bacterium]
MVSFVIMTKGISAKAELVENKTDTVINGYHSFYYQGKDGKKLKYRFFAPSKGNSKRKYPLVVHFHGAGSRGDNNTSQLYLAKKVTAGENANKYPCFVFAPQCPAGKKWVDVDWTALSHKMPVKPVEQMAMAMAAIDEIIKKYSVDNEKIYVYGQSMGGFATWDIICRRPDMFAAAVPVCGGADETKAPEIAQVPAWIFHGELDTTVKVARSQNMFAALKKAGGNPKYTEYPKVKHNAWSYSYSPKLFEWMFSQKKDNLNKGLKNNVE